MADDQKPDRSQRPSKFGALCAVVGLGCAAIAGPFVQGWENGPTIHTVAYRDIVGVWTICGGSIAGVTPGMTETVAGCQARDDRELASHAAPVVACTPTLSGHDYQLAAAVSLSYNIGSNAYCRSTVARRFNARQWRSACDAFMMWNKAGGRVVTGLNNRRLAERALCLKELPA